MRLTCTSNMAAVETCGGRGGGGVLRSELRWGGAGSLEGRAPGCLGPRAWGQTAAWCAGKAAAKGCGASGEGRALSTARMTRPMGGAMQPYTQSPLSKRRGQRQLQPQQCRTHLDAGELKDLDGRLLLACQLDGGPLCLERLVVRDLPQALQVSEWVRGCAGRGGPVSTWPFGRHRRARTPYSRARLQRRAAQHCSQLQHPPAAG
jgi:hypothetical protein